MRLGYASLRRGNTQLALAATGLGNRNPLYRPRTVASRQQVGLNCFPVIADFAQRRPQLPFGWTFPLPGDQETFLNCVHDHSQAGALTRGAEKQKPRT